MNYEVYDEILQMNLTQRRWLEHHVRRLRMIDASLLQKCATWAQVSTTKEQLRHSSMAAISSRMP